MRDFVVCVYSMSIVRITGKELPRRNQIYETLTKVLELKFQNVINYT